MGSVIKCRDCGVTVDTDDPVCACRDMQTKTISLPLEVAERFESYDETDDDMAEFRDRLRRRVPDMIF
jgi:hypothetical protein